MKKIEAIAQKTGLSSKEIKRFSKFSLLGLIALLLTAVIGCAKNDNVENPLPENISAKEEKTEGKALENEFMEKSTETSKKDHCGPYPGYPCGTRYFTVAIEDFIGFC
ncbi:MAG: hypothetical protein U9Q34_01885 [Elusimicrobiota bacterium]|nr:hypothetical protein [Elusimicrobiota bacterium]